MAATMAAAAGEGGWAEDCPAVVGTGVTYLLDLFGADDQLNGTIALSLSEAQAEALTSGGNPSTLPPLCFSSGDGRRLYQVYLELRRV
jgi:hypothetical protein